jgi:bifunctional NMN adenylyltransferase/nudix hydrolase
MRTGGTVNIGVIIGRFQVPQLTEGHKALLKYVFNENDALVVYLGVAPVFGTKRNPMSYGMRAAMLSDYFTADLFGNKMVYIEPLLDMPDSRTWADHIDRRLTACFPGDTIKLYGGRDSCLGVYQAAGGKLATSLDFNSLPGNGSDVRASQQPIDDSEEFRAGVIYATQRQYPRVNPVVDMAVFNKSARTGNTAWVLLARKSNDPAYQYRLIGGFVDSGDKSYEAAAVREVREETGLEVANPKYAGSCSIDDWRYRGGPECVKSAVYALDYVFGHPVANDDICEVEWFEVNKSFARIAPIHREALWMAVERQYPGVYRCPYETKEEAA